MCSKLTSKKILGKYGLSKKYFPPILVSQNYKPILNWRGVCKTRYYTPPEDVVRDVIKAIEKNKPRITTGRDSFRVWFISHFLPTKLINKLVWRELKPQMPHIDYHDAVKK